VRDAPRMRCAYALAIVLGVWSSAAAAAPPARLGSPLQFGCVRRLVDVHSGTGKRGYASHYVTAGSYAYGEWRASGYRGQSLWKRSGAAWCKVPTGVTVLNRHALVARGIPASVAGRLLAAMHKKSELAPPVAPAARAAQRAHRR